jgi:HlyD family secretion protein
MSKGSADTSAATHVSALRRARVIGYVAIFGFTATVGVWAATASISGAVLATSQFVTEGSLRKVQHQQGGIVAELRVREGDTVAEGDVLVRLDDTLSRSNLMIISNQLDEFAARAARLEAERDQLATMSIPAEFAARMSEPAVSALFGAERRLFEARTRARAGVREQLHNRIGQLHNEIEGLAEQRAARAREAQLIQRELSGVRTLFQQNLVQITRLSLLEREAASLEGQLGQLRAQIAQAEGKIAEVELQILQQGDDLRAETMRDLREIQARVAELGERRNAAEDQLRRIEIRAPAAGIVHQLSAHTVGGVISPAEPVMLIVPSLDKIMLEARVAPPDIDQVKPGQKVSIRLHAFNQRTTPVLSGQVTRVAADASREPHSGMTFFTVRIAVATQDLEQLSPLKLSAGMQADAFIETYARTPWQFLAKPMTDQFSKAFRER